MTEFVTISLESNKCDICEQETGEELVSCVVNDRCLRQGCDSNSLGNYKRAHRECLEKWESVMRNSMKPLGEQSKRTWKDKIKEFVNSNSGKCEERLIETLAPSGRTELISEAECLKTTTRTHCSQAGQLLRSENWETNKCNFLVDETYSVERISNTRKVRVRSVDMESVGDSENQEEIWPRQCYTAKQLQMLTVKELRDVVTSYKLQVTEASQELVNELQQRDSVLQQGETMRITIAQLVSLQQQMRANSPQKAKLGTRTQSSANTMYACI